MARRFNLDLRPLWRQMAKEEQADWSDAIASARPPIREGGGETGGSLASRIGRPDSRKVKRWGYKIRLRNDNHHLRFFDQGTVHQRARNVAPPIDERKIADRLQAEIAKQFAEWDKGAKR